MSKRKWIYFSVLTSILFFSILIVIKYCDMPVWGDGYAFRLLIKPQDADMLFYNLSVSYIVSYMFYLLVNFIPDWIEAKEKERQLISLRCAMHREIQLVIVRIVGLWESIARSAINSGRINIIQVDTIDSLFNRDSINQFSFGIELSQGSDTLSINAQRIDWYTKILTEVNDILHRGNTILTRYKDNMPSQVYYKLFYILNDSPMIAALLIPVQAVTAHFGRNIPLSRCMNFEDGTGGENIDKSCQTIIDLFNWVNYEHDSLINSIEADNAQIYRINAPNIRR